MFLCIVLLLLADLAASEFNADLNFKYKTLPRHEFIDYFNSQPLPFKIANNEHLQGKNIPKNINFNQRSRETFDLPVDTYKAEYTNELPSSFDARKNFPQCKTINDVYDQNNGTDKCNSDWAISFASSISDSMCVQMNETVRLSVEDLECTGIDICSNDSYKYMLNFFFYWINVGIVSQECRPYDIPRLRRQRCKMHCDGDRTINFKKDKRYGRRWLQANTIDDIKYNLVEYGPCSASLPIYEDFVNYSHGIYKHTFGKALGMHSLRLIGYGEESEVKYWIAANSWSEKWGEKGIIRIDQEETTNSTHFIVICYIPKY